MKTKIVNDMEIIKFYPKAWFKVGYTVNETTVDFRAWEINALNEEDPEKSEIQNNEPVIKGFIKWDGCCEFDYGTHYCGIYKAEQFLMLMKEIYRFKGNLGGSFMEEDVCVKLSLPSEKDLIYALTNQIEKLGYKVIDVKNGNEALNG